MDFNPFHLGQQFGQAFVNSAQRNAQKFADFAVKTNKVLDPTGVFAQQREYNYDLALQQQAQGFNSQEAQKDRDWQERMSNTAYQRAFKDLEAAGYNPYIALTAGAASTPGGASASSSAASVSRQNNQLFNKSMELAQNILKAGASSSASEMSALVRIAGLAILAL